jgi:hypothetical protein
MEADGGSRFVATSAESTALGRPAPLNFAWRAWADVAPPSRPRDGDCIEVELTLKSRRALVFSRAVGAVPGGKTHGKSVRLPLAGENTLYFLA